jgi:hypothetical protein
LLASAKQNVPQALDNRPLVEKIGGQETNRKGRTMTSMSPVPLEGIRFGILIDFDFYPLPWITQT